MVSFEFYASCLYNIAQGYDSKNTSTEWAQYKAVKERAVALSKNYLRVYEKNNDAEGIAYANYALCQFKML